MWRDIRPPSNRFPRGKSCNAAGYQQAVCFFEDDVVVCGKENAKAVCDVGKSCRVQWEVGLIGFESV